MHHVTRTSPAPVKLKAVLAALLLSLAVFHFAPAPLGAQAFPQLTAAAPAVELQVPYAPAPANATLYTPAPGLNVYFLNVGQGDSIYIELPGGHNALIDGGPSASATGGLASFLTAKNITHIDNVVLTHPHSDHYTGLKYVFSNLTVDNFYDTRLDNSGATADDAIRAQVSGIGINTIYPAAGDTLNWSTPAEVKVFNACSEPQSSSKSEVANNCSIVLRLAYSGSSILFMGDVQNGAEAALVARYGDALRSDVLKVGHHGSKYSSTDAFLAAVKPAKAYIEVGKNNYGHPTQDALSRLVAAGASIYRSDLNDTQEYSVGGSAEPVVLRQAD
ncbi:MAG: MBL fold metallo-hydrolase [Elusimicrobia bacterium]|nr:MBL fold metallo-hydrolase [Elusimicrobiota bacterium]